MASCVLPKGSSPMASCHATGLLHERFTIEPLWMGRHVEYGSRVQRGQWGCLKEVLTIKLSLAFQY